MIIVNLDVEIANQEIFLNIDLTKKTKSLKQFSHLSGDHASSFLFFLQPCD